MPQLENPNPVVLEVSPEASANTFGSPSAFHRSTGIAGLRKLLHEVQLQVHHVYPSVIDAKTETTTAKLALLRQQSCWPSTTAKSYPNSQEELLLVNERVVQMQPEEEPEEEAEPLTAEEVFECIRYLTDPEHPYTLEQLGVVKLSAVSVDLPTQHVAVRFTPTIPHCSQATLIGLTIKVKLMCCLPETFKVDVTIAEGTHNSEAAVNKQLTDKERVAAAVENPSLRQIIDQGIRHTDSWQSVAPLI